MKNLKDKYLGVVKLADTESYLELVPTSVFNATTRCTAVRASAAAAMNKAERQLFLEKNALVVAIREAYESHKNTPEGLPDGEYDTRKLRKICTLLSNAGLAGTLARINPKFIFKEGYFQILTGAMDIVMRNDEGTLELIRLSKAKTADTDEDTVLFYILLAYLNYPSERNIIYRKVYIAKDGPKDETWNLERKDLTEAPGLTIKKLLSSLVQAQRDKGPDCAQCMHAPYCTVLAAEMKKEAENADQ